MSRDSHFVCFLWFFEIFVNKYPLYSLFLSSSSSAVSSLYMKNMKYRFLFAAASAYFFSSPSAAALLDLFFVFLDIALFVFD